ncbi:MAG TPA: hypothetical protein VFI23_00815 [Rhizomicrobium sp.]|nr:hypothetical protein [Rhizomicrobium sp.]
MKWLKKDRATIVGGAAVFACLWLIWSSESFQSCIQTKQNADAEKAFYEGISQFLVAGGVLRGCTGYFLHQSGEAITALATIVIALFTWTLWRVSRDQGRLTQISIDDARIASQRELRAYVSAVPGKAFIKNGEFCAICRVENSGNTPAFETSCLWTLKVGEPPGTKGINFRFSNPQNDPIPTFVLYPGRPHSSVETVKLSDDDIASLKAGTVVIRAFGVVEYKDAFSDPQFATFNCYLDWTGYEMFLTTYQNQKGPLWPPVETAFKFAQAGNTASFN